MYAVVFDGKKLHYRTDYPMPKSGESLVRVLLAGICGTDLEILRGYMGYTGILGHEFVGKVINSENKDLIGKKVVGEINVGCKNCNFCKKNLERHCPHRTVLGILNRDGAYAQFLSLPEKNLHVLPDSLTDKQAVFVEPLAAAFEILEQTNIDLNSKVAIVGDGRLAQLIVQVIKNSCNDVVCYGKHKEKLEKLNPYDVTTKIGINSNDESKFDFVIEATGNISGFSDAMTLVKPRGTIILKSTVASHNKPDLTPAIIDEVTIVGSRCGPFRPAINALESGLVVVEDLIDSVFPLEKFDDALERAKKPGMLKVLLKP